LTCLPTRTIKKDDHVYDDLLIVLIGGGCAMAVSLLGLLALRLQSGSSVRMKLFTVSTATVLAMAAGVLGTAQAMFLSQHDLKVVIMVCVAVGVCAIGMSMPLARSVTVDSRALREALRALGEDIHDPAPALPLGARHSRTGVPKARRGAAMATAELEELRRELATTSTRLAESRNRERALERSRRELVAWVSHDLRTPLAGLRAMAEALEDGVAADPVRYHTQIRVAADRLTGMVDDLFELSRIHAGALRLTLTRVSLADLVDEAVVGADPLARSLGVELSAQVLTSLAVRVDPRELSRALTNLVVNAIRHTPNDGLVRVEAAEKGGQAVLAVTDSCGGLTEHDLERVFDVGWRGTAARTPEPLAGAGLGLTIVRGIVEAHAGEVTVHNVMGGCRFEVLLPVPAG
jgi:signal transduction histidine kinase